MLTWAIRIIDKFAINDSYSTTYLDDSFKRKLLTDEAIEYHQVNLLNKATIESIFETYNPDHVFDLSGDIRFDVNELQHIQSTLASYQLGQIAATHPINSFTKLTFPFYEFNSKPCSESTELSPQGGRGVWWHDSIRSLATIPNLPLSILRVGAWYGPSQLHGKITPRLMCGDIYRHLNEEMKFLWNGDLRLNTVHSEDVARALVALSKWRQSTTDTSPFNNTFKSYVDGEKLKQFQLPPKETPSRAPLFNLVDDSDATQSSVAEQIAKVFHVKTGFLGGLISAFAKMDIEEMVEDVNEKHLDAWADMLKKSDIKDTPLTPYLDEHFFKKNPIAMDASKMKKTLSFKCKHSHITTQDIQEIVNGFRVSGLSLDASYAAVTMINPGYIKESFLPQFHPTVIPAKRSKSRKEKNPPSAETLDSANQYPPTFRLQDPKLEATFCQECQLWRPPRAHHDRHARRCVWEFDHYCPWIGQSIGGNNHKHFITFLFWCVVILSFTSIALGCAYPSLISQEHGDGLWSGRGKGPIIAAISVSAFFAFFVAGLLGNHIWLACDSLTTFEDMFEIRTIRARDNTALTKHYEPWQLIEKKACRDHWYYVWGNPRTEGNLWWLGSPYRNWCFRMGANPIVWFIPFMKQKHDLLNVEYNPRFDEWGRARMRSDWPEQLR
ncbi:hypothetical protein E3P99_02357 [Wallemia hederae]|uniref:Palmitoyltransferase n=1 Tax=Wallemia hederae TaxID=1540922 RepID=A0A4T0FPS5_9BASI|nr:hypothetical protein E3P99_02357 [Wallemia hederae]